MQMIRHGLMIPVVALMIAFGAVSAHAEAPQREDVEAFLEVTGFDVALESIPLSADTAPQMLGLQADDFGSEWQRLGCGRLRDRNSCTTWPSIFLRRSTFGRPADPRRRFLCLRPRASGWLSAENSSHYGRGRRAQIRERRADHRRAERGIGSPRVALLGAA